MSNHLKQITTQAKRIRKSNPGLPWTECVSQASRDLGYGSSVGRKPKYRVYATEIKRKTKTQAKAKKVAPKPIVKAKAMPKAKPLVKAKKVYTKKQIDKVLDKIDPGKTIKKPVVKAKKTPASAYTGISWYTGDSMPLIKYKPKHMSTGQYYMLQNATFSTADKKALWNSYRERPSFPFDQMFRKYNTGNNPGMDSMKVVKKATKKPKTSSSTKQWSDPGAKYGKHLFNTKTIAIAQEEFKKGNKVVEVRTGGERIEIKNLFNIRPSRYIEFWSVYQKSKAVAGINQSKLDQVISKYLIPGGLYAGQVKFRSKILYGEPIVLVETTSNQPIDKIYTDDYEEARLLAMVLNQKSEDLRKASMNGNVKKKIRNIGNITLK